MEKNRPEKISKNLEENMKICEQMLAISKSFDLLERKMRHRYCWTHVVLMM